MLDAKRDNLDGVSDSDKTHYIEKEGKFYLQVNKVDGLALEDVTGLKSTVEKLRTNERSLTSSLKSVNDELVSVTDKFKDIDPEAAKTALSKLTEIQNWNGDTKIKEAVTLATTTVEGKMQGKIDALVAKQMETVTGLQKELTDSQNQLQDAIVNTRIVEAIVAEGGNVNLLIPHVKTQVKMVKGSNGKWKPEVVKEDGTVRIGDNSGNDMTIVQLVQEMKAQDTYAAAFPGVQSSGGGRDGSNSDNKNKGKKVDVKVVAHSDAKAMRDNFDKIASGEVVVDFEN